MCESAVTRGVVMRPCVCRDRPVICRYYGLKPDIKVISPWREWDLTSRSTLIQYAESRGIEVPSSKRGEPPFSHGRQSVAHLL